MYHSYQLRLPGTVTVLAKGTTKRAETISFSADERISLKANGLHLGDGVELQIDWPIRRGDLFPIVFVVRGIVLESIAPGRATINISRREFQVRPTIADGIVPPVPC
ncbi:MAG: hypothetical protein ABSC29_01655 [Minisyncoccia bacterium]|jgi:hypothetical protein